MDVKKTGVRVESTQLGIYTPGVKETSHKDNNNEYEYDDKIKVLEKDIPEEDVHHHHLTSPT